MRLINALKADMTFQYRQGFYWVYILLTLLYMAILAKLPQGDIKAYGVLLVVFSDPSLVGFFFIGGIVMLEKVQGVIKYLGVTPLDSWEYLVSKALSLAVVSLTAGLVITKATYTGPVNIVLLSAGILLSSVFFTLYGFLIAAGARTVNQYFVRMVPFLLLIALPCFSLLLKPEWLIFDLFPSVAGLKLIEGAFFGMSFERILLDCGLLILGTALILVLARRTYLRMLVSEEE